jgi:pimeloyl-ACP methyl ester carboxylesterase
MNAPAHDNSEKLPPIHSIRLGTSGPLVVMLHGWGRSLDSLRPLGELLATSCQVLLLDLPGFGNSPRPQQASNDGGGWSTIDYCERVKSFLDEEGATRFVLLGHSFGGRIAVRLAHRYPEIVQSLILIGAAGLKRDRSLGEQIKVRFIRALVSSAKKIDGAVGTRLFQHYLAGRVGSRDYQAAGELRRTFVKTVNEDLASEARALKHAALLLWGTEDTETPVDVARKYNALLRNSELYLFPNKGHEPFADVGAHLLCGYIERFLSTRSAGVL